MGTTKHPTYMPMWTTHSLHCPKGGYTHLRHNQIRDTFATLLDELCHDVEIESKLQSLEGESFHNKTTTTEDDARLDIKASGLWGGRFSRTFFDVKIFNPHAKSCPKTISDAYKYHESVETLKCQQRILDVEHSSFVSLIFACTEGAAPGSKKHPETSRETKRKTERIILGHNKLYKNNTSKECNPLP